MAAPILPPAKPRLSTSDLHQRLEPFAIDRAKHPLLVVGIRGYYLNTMGVKGRNDRGIYDDALFIDAPSVTAAYNGNTDPSAYRTGKGRGAGKGMACLDPGAWFVHRFAIHAANKPSAHLALCQREGEVTVTRDGTPPYKDTGMFGVNIHRGRPNSTSSLGCQTVHPGQWDSFIALAIDQAKRHFGPEWRKSVIPYVLLEG
jgi:hypothetical protein